MTCFAYIGSFLLSLLLGMLILPRILLISHKKRLFDLPDQRKIHSSPVPRLGGLAFLPTILITFCLTVGGSLAADSDFIASSTLGGFFLVCAGAMVLFLAGAVDDLIGLSYQSKFLFQTGAAVLLVFAGERFGNICGFMLPSWANAVLTVVVIVYIVNAVNLIDGVDGLASGLSAISLAVLFTLFLTCHQPAYAILSLAVLGVIIPFWFYNVFGSEKRGHKLFMGDSGSLVLGYLLAFLTLHAARGTSDVFFTGNIAVMAYSPLIIPLFDVVRVVFRRLRTGHNPFKPDKNHFHHKLLRTGLDGRQVMALMLLIAALFVILNYCLSKTIPTLWILFIDAVVWILMHLYFNWLIHSRQAKDK